MSRSNTRVVIADDDEDIRTLVRIMLTLAGYAVVAESRDGAEAVRYVEALRPDVVVLDMHMPRMSGDQAAARIREVLPTARILAFSAALQEGPAWADAWLPKSSVGKLPDYIDRLTR